jgi:hypothetical protein
VAEQRRISLGRIHANEWLFGLSGVAVLVGLALPWSDGVSGYQSFSLLKLVLELVAVAALLVPLVVARSAKTDVPIIWELFTSIAATVLLVWLLVRLVFPPDAGLDSGFYVVLAAVVLMNVGGWRSVAREY